MNLPPGWTQTTLECVVDILDGRREPINSDERQARIAGKPADQLYPYYGATGQVGWIDGYLFDEEILLVGEDGAPFLEGARSKAYVVRGKSWVNNHAHVLRALAGLTSNGFLKHYLDIFDYHGFVTGTTRLKLPQGSLRRIPLPLPPLPEQHRIVEKIEALFSELDKGVEQLKTAAQQLKVYRQSVLKWAFEGKLTAEWRKSQTASSKSQITGIAAEPSVAYGPASAKKLLERIKQEREQQAKASGKKFKPIAPLTEKEPATKTAGRLAELPALPEGWAWVRLGSVCYVRNGFAFKSSDYQSEGVLLFRQTNLDGNSVSLKNAVFLPTRFLKEFGEFVIGKGDVLVGMSGSVGKLCVYNLDEPALQNQRTGLLRFSHAVVASYVRYYFEVLEEEFINKSKGVAVLNISGKDIEGSCFPLPSVAEQHQIVQEIESRLSVCDKLEETIAASLQQSEALRQSILKKAFEGKLVAQNPLDEPASVLLDKIKGEKQQTSADKLSGSTRRGGRPSAPTRAKL